MTRAEVTRAQKLRDKGLTYAEIAEKFGVSDTTIRRWLKPKLVIKNCVAYSGKPVADFPQRRHPHQVTMAKLNRDVARIENAEAEVFEALVPEKRGKIAQWWRDFRKAFLTFDDEEPLL